MCSLRTVAAVLALFLTADLVQCQRYTVPEAKVELLRPKGLRISIPDDDPEITLVAFHININEEFQSLDHGHFARDIIKRKDGRWTYTNDQIKVKQGDTIYYWIYVIVGLGYHGLDRSYKVTERCPHGCPSDPTPTPPVVTTTEKICIISESRRDGDQSVCKDEVLHETIFRGLNQWSHEVHIGGTLPEDEFTVFTKDSDVSFVENGNLVIKPILMEDKYDDTFVRTGNLNLPGCTSSLSEHCSKQAATYLILPPIMSARLSTRQSFSFRYGIVEVRAKLPRGDWVVPELWLQPKNGGVDRITLALSKGNAAFNSRLEAGVILHGTSQHEGTTENTPWSRDYHTYKLTWTPDSLVFAVDNHEYAHLPVRDFNEECYITLGVHVAGSRDFLDYNNKPWNNTDPKRMVRFWEAKDSWLPSWNQNSLRVESVKVTAL